MKKAITFFEIVDHGLKRKLSDILPSLQVHGRDFSKSYFGLHGLTVPTGTSPTTAV